MKKIVTSVILCCSVLFVNAQLIKNDFMAGLEVGDDLEKGSYAGTVQGDDYPLMANQWSHSGKENDTEVYGYSAKVIAPLTYTGYIESGKSNAMQLARFEKLDNGTSPSRMTIYSLTSKSDYAEGNYYAAMMVKVEEVGSSGGADFFTFDGNYTGNNQRAKIYAKNSDSGDADKFIFGISDEGSSPKVTTATEYTKGETLLLVFKYDFDNIGAGKGGIKLFINPDLTSTVEPATAALSVDITSALTSIRGLLIRQRATTKIQIGGIRFAQSWTSAVGSDSSTGISGTQTNDAAIYAAGKTIVTGGNGAISVFSLTGAEILSQAVNGSLDTNLSSGMYIVRFADENGNISTGKIAIQ